MKAPQLTLVLLMVGGLIGLSGPLFAPPQPVEEPSHTASIEAVLRDATPYPSPQILWEATAYGRDSQPLTTREGHPVMLYLRGDEMKPSSMDEIRNRLYPDIEVHGWSLTKVPIPAAKKGD